MLNGSGERRPCAVYLAGGKAFQLLAVKCVQASCRRSLSSEEDPSLFLVYGEPRFTFREASVKDKYIVFERK